MTKEELERKEYSLYMDEFDTAEELSTDEFYDFQKEAIPAAFGLKPASEVPLTDPANWDPDDLLEKIIYSDKLRHQWSQQEKASKTALAADLWNEVKKSYWQDEVSIGGETSRSVMKAALDTPGEYSIGYSNKSWAKKITPGLMGSFPKSGELHNGFYDKKIDYIGEIGEIQSPPIEAKMPAKPRKPRYPAYKKDDRVNTPEGLGNVWSVDRDGTVCVELDKDPSILHEFEKKELKKIKK